MSTTAHAEIASSKQQDAVQISVLSNESFCRKLGETLEQLGMNAESTDVPREALLQIAGEHDVVLLCDLDLPSIGGLEFLAEVRGVNSNARVVFLSDSYSPESALQAIRRGAYDYLQKPVQPARLKEAVQSLLSGFRRERQWGEINRQLTEAHIFHGMVGCDPITLDLFDQAQRMARHYTSMLLTGPSGAGKEALARAIHAMSPAAGHRFVVCQCSSLTEGTIEDQLFGHSHLTAGRSLAGDQNNQNKGIDFAHVGTIFLDEVGDAPHPAQAKLLRLLSPSPARGASSSDGYQTGPRIIASSTRDLRAEVVARRFREDLFCLLGNVQIHLPPLADRRGDIPMLADYFIHCYNKIHPKEIHGLTRGALAALVHHAWPGNIRELETVISAAALASVRGVIDLQDLPETIRQPLEYKTGGEAWQPIPLRDVRTEHIEKVLEACNGNRVRAAQMLGIGRTSLYRYLKRRTNNQTTPRT